MTNQVQATGSATPIQKPRRQLLTRPLTARKPIATRPVTHSIVRQRPITDMGLRGNYELQAEQMYLCLKLIASDHSVAEIMSATGLREAFVYTLAEKIWGN